MKDQLAKALEADDARSERSDRILRAAFFRKRPLQAGTTPVSGIGSARIVSLDDRRAQARN